MIIYLSGPMNGEKDYREIFEAAAQELTAVGHKVINPAELVQTAPEGTLTRADFLLIDLQMLAHADCMVTLPGWRESSGCRAEWAFCRAVGIPVHKYELSTAVACSDACPIGGCR